MISQMKSLGKDFTCNNCEVGPKVFMLSKLGLNGDERLIYMLDCKGVWLASLN